MLLGGQELTLFQSLMSDQHLQERKEHFPSLARLLSALKWAYPVEGNRWAWLLGGTVLFSKWCWCFYTAADRHRPHGDWSGGWEVLNWDVRIVGLQTSLLWLSSAWSHSSLKKLHRSSIFIDSKHISSYKFHTKFLQVKNKKSFSVHHTIIMVSLCQIAHACI